MEHPLTAKYSHANKVFAALDEALREMVAGLPDLVDELVQLREAGGRLFVLGIGGGAANATHAANDMRKLCGIEAYAPTDSVAELTARANDEGWGTIFTGWLHVSRIARTDALLIFSVGGGTATVSPGLHNAIMMAREVGARVFGVVGPNGGSTFQYGDVVLRVRRPPPELVTPVTEAAQMAVVHCLVSDPRLQQRPTKW